jgi:hypothetical protein
VNERPFHCPTLFESFLKTSQLWPRGRAWPVSDGVTPTRYWEWLIALGGLIPSYWPTGYVQSGYNAAIAYVRNFIEERLCALRLEFWCETKTETFDQWMIEYGLPDDCDPFPDLCTKVAAIGGTRCEYYQAVAARAGWDVTCTEVDGDCGAVTGCATTGCDVVGGSVGASMIVIRVFLDESPAYVSVLENPAFVGNFQCGFSLACEPDITPLKCILDRIVHAHLVIEYVIEGGTPDTSVPDEGNLSFLVDIDQAFVIDTDGANIMVEAS